MGLITTLLASLYLNAILHDVCILESNSLVVLIYSCNIIILWQLSYLELHRSSYALERLLLTINILCLSSEILRIENLLEVQNAVWPARAKYYCFGVALGVSPDDLDAFEKSNAYRVDECFMEVLKYCLRQKEGLSQQKLADALASNPVGLGNLADEIRCMRF